MNIQQLMLVASMLISSHLACQSLQIRPVQCNNWVEYVYTRGFDIMLRDARVSVYSDGLPVRNDFRPIGNVVISRKLETELQTWLQLDSLSTSDMTPVYAQAIFDSIDIRTMSCVEWVDSIRGLEPVEGHNYILSAFSEIYRKGKYYYFRGVTDYFVNGVFEYSNTVIFKIELCEGEIAIFKEAIVPLGLTHDKNHYIVVSFNDKPCMR